MKQILLSLLCVATFTMAQGQNFESFEGLTGGELPECWSTVDADADGVEWFTIDDPGVTALTGTGVLYSESWNGAPLTPDNYAVLPQLSIASGDQLNYFVAAQDPDWVSENYSVVLSTSGSAPADFSVVLFEETLTDTSWTEHSIDVSAYEGQTVYIAFRHHDVSDFFTLKIDDVTYPTTTEAACGTVTSIQENEGSVLGMYPNPVVDVLTISTEVTEGDIVEVLNSLGQVILSERVNGISSQYQIDMSEFAAGIYSVVLRTELGTSQGKVYVD